MRSISVREFDGTVVVEVEGVLDIVAGHDLRRLVAQIGDRSNRTVVLDLTRVGAVDADGIGALEWCSDWAIEQCKVLRWSGCSGPTRATLARRPRPSQGPRR
jgi:anti-anti-sigma regulatory factor